ncbi:MAG: hypothetical protein KF715_10785 [Candidatus Didemnitutus sp.]|nr:hypothetical protein [Candidatus Didemnitutus sp.]
MKSNGYHGDRIFNFYQIGSLIWLIALFLTNADAQDLSVNGKLDVAGNVDIAGNRLTLGAQSGSYGAGFFYFDQDTDTFSLRLNRPVSSWLWEYELVGSTRPSMRLDAAHKLIVYDANGSAAISLDSGAKKLVLGDAFLQRDTAGVLRTPGGLVVDGAFSSSSLTATTGTITGAAGDGLTLNAGGSDNSIILVPTGIGVVRVGGSLVPNIDDAADLGSSLLRWRTVHVKGQAQVGSLLLESGSIIGDTSLILAAGGAGENVDIAANGSGRVRVHSRLDISTPEATIARFTRTGTTPDEAGMQFDAEGALASLHATNVAALRISINSNEAVRIDENGNILVGRTAPAPAGRIHLPDHTTAAGGIALGDDVVLHRAGPQELKTNAQFTATRGARFDGPVRIAPQGDIPMGEFTAEPQP